MKTKFAVFLAVAVLSLPAAGQELFSASPLKLLTERVDTHDQQICDLDERLTEIESKLDSVASAKPEETIVRVVIDDNRAKVTAVASPTTPKVTSTSTVVTTSPARSASRRYKSSSQIRSEIARKRTSRVYATISPNTRAWAITHLKGEHGFTSAQVDGLSHDEAWHLHNLAHPGIITPYTSATVARVETFNPTPRTPTPNPQPRYNGGCPNGRCPTVGGSRSSGGWFPGKLLFGR